MRAFLATVTQLAETDSSVLITGESGTGKELLARALYKTGAAPQRALCGINCARLPEALLESELFGHAGRFTGAVRDDGLFEEAHGGTLFLDEIGEMPPAMQVRMLRFLQGGEVGASATRTRRVDVRLVAATQSTLGDEVAAGRFREDLISA